MSKSLSVDLRVRVVAAVSAGATHREAAERFGVSAASVSRWRNLQLRQGDVRPGPLGGDRNSRKTEAHGEQIMTWLAEHRDGTLFELRDASAEQGITISKSALHASLSVSDGVDAPTYRHLCARMVVLEPLEGRASMEKISIIGLDLAKSVIQVHAATADGSVLFRRKISSKKLLAFLSEVDPCIVAMEACAGSHHWGREIGKLGHRVKLIAPIYVKPFVKRQKNDAADAEAICEAAMRPTMRFVAVKSEEKQAAATVFKVRDLLVRQKTQIINALRGLMAEFGITAPQGPSHVGILINHVEDDSSSLTEAARAPCLALVVTLRALIDKVRELDLEIGRRARHDDVAKRLMSIPGIGPVIATALEALAPPAETFTRGRDFSAWMGLTPRQHSSGGKARLGKTSKMGQRDLRRLLIIGASAVVRWASRRGALEGSRLSRMIGKKPPMLITVALANRMGRIAWALMTNGGRYEENRLAA